MPTTATWSLFIRSLRVVPEGLGVVGEVGGVLVGSVGGGRADGVVGPDVSKTEEIKASVAWVPPRNHAMTWCFRRAFSALSVSRWCRAA